MNLAGYSDTYYSTTIKDGRRYPALSGKVETDVCIVGAGLAGVNTALGLVMRGKNVALVESGRIGWGASGRNAGFVAKGYAAGEANLADKLGVTEARKLVEQTKNARKLIRQRITDFNIDCGPIIGGVLTASWKDNTEELRQYISKANDNFDLGFEFWPRDKVREHCRTEKYYDALYSPHDFQMNPLIYLRGLANVVADKGGQVFEESAVTRVMREGGSWVVQTAQGSVRAKDVVMCCSVYMEGLDRRLENAAVPVQTYIMVTKPISEDVYKTSVNTRHAVSDTRFCGDYYRRLDDGRILWGGRVSLFGSPENIAKAMLEDMFNIYPQLKGHVQPEFSWAGLLSYAAHKMPQIGKIEEGYWYNTGFGGHGIAPTTVGGELIASAIAEGDRTYEEFAPFGISFVGGKLGKYGAQALYLWWRARDYLGV